LYPSEFSAINTVSAKGSQFWWNTAGVDASSTAVSKHFTHVWPLISGWAWRKASVLGSGSDGCEGSNRTIRERLLRSDGRKGIESE
jgi:hypothetical protein